MVDVLHSYPTPRSLLNWINDVYNVGATRLHLHRDMIGSVYFLGRRDTEYVFKLFRCGDTEQALQSLAIVEYLEEHAYPVAPVVPTRSGDRHAVLDMPEGTRVGILYEFLKGVEPNFDTDIRYVGKQTGRLHNLMDSYQGPLMRRGKKFYIDRYIDLMRESEYRSNRIEDLAEYGDLLWRRMEQLPAGFCHGDLHSGNMVKTLDKTYALFDFDVASYAFPVIDAATLSDETHYNHIEESAFDATQHTFDNFYGGYSQERTLSDLEAAAIFDFIAIRHYELNATVTIYRAPVVGQHWLRAADSYDEQYEWLMEWANICERKRPV